MFSHRGAIVGLAILFFIGGSPTPAPGQTPADPPATHADPTDLCRTYQDFPIAFVGRAGERITFRVSGEDRVEEARQNLVRTKDDVARLRASLDPKAIDLEMETELEVRIIRAESELDDRRARYPPPFDVSFIPVQVEHAFRGVREPTIMVQWRDDTPVAMEPGELYLIRGIRMTDQLPSLPGIPDPFGFKDYVIPERATPVGLAAEDLRFLVSTASGATVLGNLRMLGSYDGPAGAPLGGIRVMISSGDHVAEAMTREDGNFTVSGILAGRLEIKPLLREDLTVVNRSSLTFEVGEGGCQTLSLQAGLNGRVRGRVVSATGTSLTGVALVLSTPPPPDHCCSRGPTTTIRPNEDGTYEFFGQSPGSYILSARHVRIENGKEHSLITYYPGTADPAEALPIVIGKASQLDGFDFLVMTE